MRATALGPVDVEGGAERLGKRGVGAGAGRLHGRSPLGQLGLGEPHGGAESRRERQGSRASASAWGRFLPVSDSPRRLTMPGHSRGERLGRRRVLHERTVERRVAEHRGEQRDARAHPPAFLVERRRVSRRADALVDRDQDRRADHAVPRQREAPAPVGLGQGVARAPVRWAGGQQRVAASGKRPPIDPEHAAAARGASVRGDRPALERECVAQAAEPAACALERDAVVAQEARSGDVGVVELVEQLRHARERLDGRAARRRRSARSSPPRHRPRSRRPTASPWETRARRDCPACARSAATGAMASSTSSSRAGRDARQLVVVGDAAAGARDQHERRRAARFPRTSLKGVPWPPDDPSRAGRGGGASASSSSSRAPTRARRRANRASSSASSSSACSFSSVLSQRRPSRRASSRSARVASSSALRRSRSSRQRASSASRCVSSSSGVMRRPSGRGDALA